MQIASMLGHEDSRIIERVDANRYPDFQTKATGMLDRLVGTSEMP